MKRLPQGVWRDTLLDNKKLVVVYYDSRERAYRVEYLNTGGLRNWVSPEEFQGGRFKSMGVWGHLLRPVVKAENFCFASD